MSNRSPGLIYRILLYIFCAYLGLVLYAQFSANQKIFLPSTTSYQDNFDIIKLKSADGSTLSALYLQNPRANYTILYSQGNASDIGIARPLLEYFQKNGFSVFTYDYPDFGTSSGKPTEKNTYHAINAAYDYLTKTLNIPPNKILAYGQSLGAALSIDLATRKPIAGLIIQSPFLSAFRVYTQIPLIPFDKYNNAKKITRLLCPLFVIHGTADSVIPFWHGKSLYHRAEVPKMSYWVLGADHNDIISVSADMYFIKMDEFINTHLSKTQH